MSDMEVSSNKSYHGNVGAACEIIYVSKILICE